MGGGTPERSAGVQGVGGVLRRAAMVQRQGVVVVGFRSPGLEVDPHLSQTLQGSKGVGSPLAGAPVGVARNWDLPALATQIRTAWRTLLSDDAWLRLKREG